jgi:ParB-like chromosome segregation protein Spo0J
MTQKISKISIDKLLPAEYNPRKDLQQGDAEYDKLKKSLETFGCVEPIVINSDMTVIGGHQRLKVLRELGYSDIDCVVVNLDKTKEKALNVALNKISGEWDMPKLKDLLLEIDSGAYDVTLTGFDMAEIENLMTQFMQETEDIDAKKEATLGGLYLSIGNTKVPITDEEQAALLERLNEYVEQNGVPFGFAGVLLNG